MKMTLQPHWQGRNHVHCKSTGKFPRDGAIHLAHSSIAAS